jgi:uncharacterized protein DUF6518
MTPVKKVLATLLAAGAFGVAAGMFKGDAPGLRGGIGNLSAPWLLVAFLPALPCRTARRGALMGLASTAMALSGFYLALTVILTGHLGGGGHVRELLVEVGANRVYFIAGLVTGPLFGAAGAWVGRRRPDLATPVAGSLLAGEIVAVALAQGHQLAPAPLYFVWAVDAWPPYVAECLLGLGIIAAAVARRRSRSGPAA